MLLLLTRVRGLSAVCLATVVISVAMLCLGCERVFAEDLGIFGGTGGARLSR